MIWTLIVVWLAPDHKVSQDCTAEIMHDTLSVNVPALVKFQCEEHPCGLLLKLCSVCVWCCVCACESMYVKWNNVYELMPCMIALHDCLAWYAYHLHAVDISSQTIYGRNHSQVERPLLCSRRPSNTRRWLLRHMGTCRLLEHCTITPRSICSAPSSNLTSGLHRCVRSCRHW